MEDLRPLEDLYHGGPEKSFHLAVRNLFTQTLAGWSQGRFAVGRRTPLRLIFNRRLGILPQQSSRALDGERLRELTEHLSSVGIDVTKSRERLSFDLAGGPYSYADPSRPLSESADVGRDTLLVHVPGELSGRNVLVDGGERVWVTDFAAAGLAPPLWSLAELEAVVRFDWVDVSRLEWLHKMEHQLVFGDFIKLQPNEVEPPLRKPLRAIQAIRQLTKQVDGKDTRSCHFAVLLYAARRLAALRKIAGQPSLRGMERIHEAAKVFENVSRSRVPGLAPRGAEAPVLDEKGNPVTTPEGYHVGYFDYTTHVEYVTVDRKNLSVISVRVEKKK